MLEAQLSMKGRLGVSVEHILVVQSNLAGTYEALGRIELALSMRKDVYSGTLKLNGEEDTDTLLEANNYADSLNNLNRFEEAKVLLRKTMPVAQRVLGESDETTMRMRTNYAEALFNDDGAALGDLRKAVATFGDTERTARRVFGGAHPLTKGIEDDLREARAALAARETSARMEEAPARVERVEEASARLEEALARVDRLERELVEARRQVAELLD